jgi:hypothetical protein
MNLCDNERVRSIGRNRLGEIDSPGAGIGRDAKPVARPHGEKGRAGRRDGKEAT